MSATYTRNADGTPKGCAVAGKQNKYVLGGPMFCGACGAPMIIHGGAHPVYRCPDYSKRGTCSNSASVREAVAREQILAALRERLLSQDGVAFARKRIAEELGDLARSETTAAPGIPERRCLD